MESYRKSFSLMMLILHRRQKREAIDGKLKANMYLRILVEMVKSGRASRGEILIHCEEDDELSFQGVKIRLISDFNKAELDPTDVLFIRGDKKVYLPIVRKSYKKVERLLFYGASGKAIPRHGLRFHGILVDNTSQTPIIHNYYPGVYVGAFLKTAIPETFFPMPKEKKEFDVCMVGAMRHHRKNLIGMKEAIAALPDVKFVICGTTDNAKIESLGAGLGQITCKGFITQEELNKVINRSRLAVIPSNESDASPRIILEYAAAGIPILANSEMCGADKFVLPEAGRIAHLSEFARIIPEMLATINTFNAHDAFNEHFSPEKVGEDFAKHIHAIMQMPAKPPSPSLRGRLARLTRLRIDEQHMKLKG